MENVNPLPTNNRHVLPDVLRSIERFLNRFANQPNETSINDPESDDGLVDTPIVPPFPHSDNDSDDEEVLNRLSRKAHLLEDKQIPSVDVFDEVYFAFGRHLEELHVTWAHLEKKRTRLRTYTNISQDYVLSGWRWRH
ncbi:hypothetical protein Tco_0204494 [Tanacetum coccineum]